MREIKFRAWDHQKKEWGYFSIYDISRCKYHLYGNWCEFTGLLDKNGKDIYEGDIVKCTMHYGNDRGERCGKGEERITAVKWSKQDGMQMVGFSFFPCDDINQLEVIGNIHENPELLKG